MVFKKKPLHQIRITAKNPYPASCRKQVIILYLALFLILPGNLISHRSFASPDKKRDASFPVILIDQGNRKITIQSRPRRIISLTPGTTEILYSLGLSDSISGVDNHSNYPPEVSNKMKLGGPNFNYERIVALNPDLVIIEPSLYPMDARKIRKLDLTVMEVEHCDNYVDFLRSVQLIGKATGKEKEAKAYLAEINEELRSISQKANETLKSKEIKVFIEIWYRPLMTAGGDTFVDFLIRTAGGTNIAQDLTYYPWINPETLLVKDPDVIILTTVRREDFMAETRWKNLSAVKNKRVYKVDPDILVRPGKRMLKGCRLLLNAFSSQTP